MSTANEGVEPARVVSRSRPSLAPLAALWAVVWILLVLLENVGYLHDHSLPRWQLWTILGVPAAVLGAWLAWDIHARRYERVPLDPARGWFVMQLRRMPLLVAGYVILAFGLRQWIFTTAGAVYWHRPWMELILYECIKASLLYGLWLALVYGTLSSVRVRDQAAQLSHVQAALMEAQLSRLHAQLRPHFLFNTLNTVSALMHVDVARADRVLTRLGDLLRESLGAAERPTVSFADELRLLELYAGIMQERFADRLVMGWRIDPAALAVRVPALLVQPLLENAFKYGIEQSLGPQRVEVSAGVSAGRLWVRIHNTGSALAPTWRDGIGIGNCRERLRVVYGDAADVVLANDGDGVLAELSVPVSVA